MQEFGSYLESLAARGVRSLEDRGNRLEDRAGAWRSEVDSSRAPV